ncbi:neurogenic locus notch homolog protein 1-like isoform X2 [Dreissena polymorpha]|uniref:neurogenic locus notch homolog protein 1-like isoform X2 n=1 Tax=Dreissena polymorpha TaxID=45954 RepID=UPI002263E590|nr:neurogenic locus notch homolog protein 1-like isoform X2 [Dreissena polymorpha]
MFLLVVRLTLLQVILNRGYSVEACSHDNECPHCTGHNFQARCRYNYCDCYPVDCDPSPCPSTLICVAEPDDYSCREHCTVNCPVGQTCIKTNRGQICIDPCVPNPCSSGKTCVHRKNAPFYVCEAPHTTPPTTRLTDPATTKETSTFRTTHQSTTEAASTSSPVPTPTPQQSDYSEFST